MSKIKKIAVVLLGLIILTVPFFSFSVGATGTVFQCRDNCVKIRSGTTEYTVDSVNIADFSPAPNAVWYSPLNSSIGDYEMHFAVGGHISAGDKLTLTYDIYFPAGLNSSTQIFISGLADNYISANGRWVNLLGESYFHWVGTVSFTAGQAFDSFVIIPRGMASSNMVAVNYLNLTVENKDYTGAINGASEDIKNNQNKNTEDIKNNQDKNTDKQIQADKDAVEKEKQETEKAGNDAISDTSGSIEDKSSGFFASVKKLADAFTTTSLASQAVKLPAMYIPAIPNVCDKIPLTKEMTIDISSTFSQYVPMSIQQIVRAILTSALIVFCFKELYGIVQYVLTLKGGNSDE